ncbi:hypothetical protein BU23DRAFT_564418 [Bimuria novae-zelandiae CBS 107.79]|uniref:Uncharacterized protein n=1 Tax=Bimuria novae-zelandiae CBS 107.79 TaxID=1447943 RepID=A0A6A5VYC5_9PLEO|nr:hypothetical protein BU23DRAFT_564418 [Bimuria novae-zelandiae CBS 107.79]
MDTTRRILVALAQWSGGAFQPRSYPADLEPTWTGASLSSYHDHLRMMDAAYFGTQEAHWWLSLIYTNAQHVILAGYHRFPHEQLGIQGFANAILAPAERWVVDVGPNLEEVAHAMENLGPMILAEAAKGDKKRVEVMEANGAGQPMTLAFRDGVQSTGSHAVLPTAGRVNSSIGAEAVQAATSEDTQAITAVQPSQATLNDINDIIEKLSRQHLTN